MFLSRITIAPSRAGLGWLSNPYRIHQRLKMACTEDPRILFRVEGDAHPPHILVQTYLPPSWEEAFGEVRFLSRPVEMKQFELRLLPGQTLRFRLCANPAVKRDGRRQGLLVEDDQRKWLERKLSEAGSTLIGCLARPVGFIRSHKTDIPGEQVHWQVCFEGLLCVQDVKKLTGAVVQGIGPGKGYGCGLLSLARPV